MKDKGNEILKNDFFVAFVCIVVSLLLPSSALGNKKILISMPLLEVLEGKRSIEMVAEVLEDTVSRTTTKRVQVDH